MTTRHTNPLQARKERLKYLCVFSKPFCYLFAVRTRLFLLFLLWGQASYWTVHVQHGMFLNNFWDGYLDIHIFEDEVNNYFISAAFPTLYNYSFSISIFLSIYLSFYLSIYLSIYLHIYLSIYLNQYIYLYLSRFIRERPSDPINLLFSNHFALSRSPGQNMTTWETTRTTTMRNTQQ